MAEERPDILKQIDENPDSVAEFTREQVDEATQGFRDLLESDVDLTVEELEAIDAHTSKLEERATELDEADAARQERLTGLRERLGITEEEAEEIEAEETTEEPEAPEGEEPTEVVTEVTEEEVVEEPETVAASAKPTIGALSKRIPESRKPRQEPVSLVASGGERQGSKLTTRNEFGSYMQKAWRGAGIGRFTIASYGSESDPARHKFNLTDSPGHNAAVLAEVQEAAMSEGNLVASGGFCAPAEVLYDFFNISTRSGLVTLPTVGAPRGAVQFPVSPTLADFIGEDGIASVWTNSTDENPGESTKPVFTVDCPETSECEVAAYVTILQFGNFGARFYPENVANATTLAMNAAARVINAAAITALDAASVVTPVANGGGGGIANLYQVLASQSAHYRQSYGMGLDAPLDLIVPHWLDDALAADAVARDSTTEYADVVRRVRGIFAELNLRVQYVYDYQNLVDGFFPAEADVLLMAPGTAVRLDAGTLDLGVVRDSTLNATNDYQTFVEEFVGWCFPGHEVRSIEGIAICPTGGTGDRETIACATSS